MKGLLIILVVLVVIVIAEAPGGNNSNPTTTTQSASQSTPAPAKTVSSSYESGAEVLVHQEEHGGWTGEQVLALRKGLEIGGSPEVEAICGAVYTSTHYSVAEATSMSTEERATLSEAITGACAGGER